MMKMIVIDGIDGSGKSTIASWVEEHYASKGEKVTTRTHPSESFFGRLSRRSLTSEGKLMKTLATFFFILDVLDSLRRMKRWKDLDKVIFVRYVMATAYLPRGFHRAGYKFFCKVLPIPPRLLLVDTTPECALRRIEARDHQREMFENLESLTKVRRKVLDLADRDWKVLDNSGPMESSRAQLDEVLAAWDSLS